MDEDAFLLIGGFDGVKYLRLVFKYTISINALELFPDMVIARKAPGIYRLNNTIYLFGGFDEGIQINKCEKLDISGNLSLINI